MKVTEIASQVRKGDLEAVQSLLDAQGKQAAGTVYLQAAKYGRVEVVELCLAAGYPMPAARVFEAALTDFVTVPRNPGHRRVLELALDQGLKWNHRIGWMKQPLLCECAMYGNAILVDRILRERPILDLFSAVSVGEVETVRTEARAGGEALRRRDANGFTALHYCASSALGLRDPLRKDALRTIARLLIEAGVKPDRQVDFQIPLRPVFLCCWFGGDEAILEMLVKAGADPRANGNSALEFALEPHQRSGEPFYHLAAKLLELGVDLRGTGPGSACLALHQAAWRGTLKAVRWLLEQGADPNRRDPEGRTPLHRAAQRNTTTGVVKLLLAQGAEVNARDHAGHTPLFHATEKGRVKVQDFLIQQGAVMP